MTKQVRITVEHIDNGNVIKTNVTLDQAVSKLKNISKHFFAKISG